MCTSKEVRLIRHTLRAYASRITARSRIKRTHGMTGIHPLHGDDCAKRSRMLLRAAPGISRGGDRVVRFSIERRKSV